MSKPLLVDNKPVSEEEYEQYAYNHPTQLENVDVIAPPTIWDQLDDLYGSGNPIWGINRLKAFNKAYSHNPHFMDNWQLANNIVEGVHNLTGGILNRLSPTQNIGFIIDAIKGKNLLQSHMGNSGIVSDNFANKYPLLSTAINMAGDLGLSAGMSSLYRYGTTLRPIGNGAEAEVYSAPLSRYVYKLTSIEPDYMDLKHQVPEVLPSEYMGTTESGLYIYRQPKAFIPKKYPKKLDNMYKRMIRKQWFPFQEEDGIYDFIDPANQLVVTDLGPGNIGWYRGRYRIIDPSVLPLDEYTEMFYKTGGKFPVFKNKQ